MVDSFSEIALLSIIAFVAATIHGATGLAGGVILAAVASHMIGVKPAFVLVVCALVISHSSRVFWYRQDIDWKLAKDVLLWGFPGIVFSSWLFQFLSSSLLAWIMASVLLLSIPIKVYARLRQIRTSRVILRIASGTWGFLTGNVIGPGFFLAPFLQGTGISRLQFVATLAVIVLCMNVTKLVVYIGVDVVSRQDLLLGIWLGVVSIPANALGRRVLLRSTEAQHRLVINVMTIAMVINFLYLACL